MKKLLLVLFLINTQSWGIESLITCEGEGEAEYIGIVKSSFKAKVQDIVRDGKSELALSAYKGSYIIAEEEDDEYPWSKGEFSAEGMFFNDYIRTPYRYKNHSRFSVYFDSDVGSGYGEFQYILPNDLMEQKSFKAYIIMNHIDDHFGTTLPIECHHLNAI
jgi:hypothetical protein